MNPEGVKLLKLWDGPGGSIDRSNLWRWMIVGSMHLLWCNETAGMPEMPHGRSISVCFVLSEQRAGCFCVSMCQVGSTL